MERAIKYYIAFEGYNEFKSTKKYEFITGLLSEYGYRMNDMPYAINDIDQCLNKKAHTEWYHHVISVYYDDDDNVFIACFCKKSVIVFAFPYVSKTSGVAHLIVKDLLQHIKTDEVEPYEQETV